MSNKKLDFSLVSEYENKSPVAILKLAFEYTDNIAISFSGAEDVVLVDMAIKLNPNAKIFSLDTGRLHPETYRFLESVRDHYNTNIEILSPNHENLQKLIKQKGLYSFYRDGHEECCSIRKVSQLRCKLMTLDAWVTGQRKDQNPDTRGDIPVFECDNNFSGKSDKLIKFNPLSNWSSTQVWEYIIVNDIPFNSLHKQGYISIGCEPCTRAVLPNQHEREGRWWWEETNKKECGLHADNILTK